MKALARQLANSAVAWTFLGTLLRVGAGVLVLPLVLHKLPPEHLGMWYVFGSLGSFAMLLDLGFEATITRMAAYAWAGAPRLTAFGLADAGAPGLAAREPNRPLLTDIVATLRAYYGVLGFAVLLLLIVGGGSWVWHKSAGLADPATVRGAWLVYAIGLFLNFIGGRWPALLSGIGSVQTGQQIVVIGLAIYYLVAVAGLAAGYGLWSLVGAMVLMGMVVRALGRRAFRRAAALAGGIPAARFHREIFAAIWPNAWRIGLVSLGTFFIINANTLVCSAYLDLATTASYGISFQLVTMLVGISGVWVFVKQPLINQLRVSGDHVAIARIFATRLRLAIVTYALGAVVLIFVAPFALGLIGSKTHLLPLGPLLALCLIQLLEMHHSLYAGLVLSENLNPFLKPALISGVVIVVSSVVLTPIFGVWGLLMSVGIVQASFNNWWTVVRAVGGLDLPARQYWSYLLLFRDPWKTA